jgi:oxygen-independent coproporphyrinogen-3 oxidase
LIDPELIKKIVQQICKYFRVRASCEITIECNPESVDEHRVCVWQEGGVTRFSLGVQSLDKKTLWRVARPHDETMIFRALEIFKKSRMRNFGTDFIMGLPGQTLRSFRREVETILKYRPTHGSFYFLSYDTKRIDLFAKECPDEATQIAMYEWLCRRLKRSGFIHYEVSNWAKKGYECEHNKRYWEQKDYLGIGLGAHSIVDGVMWENESDFEAYLRDPLHKVNEMPIDHDLRRMEYIMLRLRTHEGVNLKRYAEMGDVAKLLERAKTFIVSGHLQKLRGHLRPTESGFLILEMITGRLIAH